MKRFSLDDCLREGLLRRVPPSPQRADGSLKAAYRWLEDAQRSIDAGAYNPSVLSSYLAMFHSSRAILYLDGYREKSHYCIARYLDKYVADGRLETRWVELLDHQRELRHESQYNFSFITTKTEAEATLTAAKTFVTRMASLKESIRQPRK